MAISTGTSLRFFPAIIYPDALSRDSMIDVNFLFLLQSVYSKKFNIIQTEINCTSSRISSVTFLLDFSKQNRVIEGHANTIEIVWVN